MNRTEGRIDTAPWGFGTRPKGETARVAAPTKRVVFELKGSTQIGQGRWKNCETQKDKSCQSDLVSTELAERLFFFVFLLLSTPRIEERGEETLSSAGKPAIVKRKKQKTWDRAKN